MPFATSSSSTLYVGKTTTTSEPATYQVIKPVSHSLSPNAGSFQGQFLDPSGKGQDQFRKAKSGGGDIASHWLPGDFDSMVEVAARGAFGAAFTDTLTITFTLATSDGIQTVNDTGATGSFDSIAAGDTVYITGAVNPENNGVRIVVSSPLNDTILVFNPAGLLETATPSVGVDNNGTLTLGTTASWLWVERKHSDGTQDTHSAWYQNQLLSAFRLSFPAGDASSVSWSLLGDSPIIDTASASNPAPIADQRGGSDNLATTARLVHGMDDVQHVFLYSPTLGTIDLCNRHSLFEFSLSRQIAQDEAVCTPNIVNTNVGPPTVGMTINAYLDETGGTGRIQEFFDSYPDDLVAGIVYGATDATKYGIWLENVRTLSAADPVQGNTQSVQINATFGATDFRMTRI